MSKCLHRIENNPYLFPILPGSNTIHYCLVTKQNKLYYEIEGNIIYVIALEDTRINPEKIKL